MASIAWTEDSTRQDSEDICKIRRVGPFDICEQYKFIVIAITGLES